METVTGALPQTPPKGVALWKPRGWRCKSSLPYRPETGHFYFARIRTFLFCFDRFYLVLLVNNDHDIAWMMLVVKKLMRPRMGLIIGFFFKTRAHFCVNHCGRK